VESIGKDLIVAGSISASGVHHLRLTVTDVERSRTFYTEVLGFEQLADFGGAHFLSNGSVGLGIGPSPDPAQAISDDRFNENRVGLDHLSFSVATRADLEAAVKVLDEHGVPHGEITDLGEGFGICILAFRDPDNIQLELCSPR
jgi:glyoxylase I family protein